MNISNVFLSSVPCNMVSQIIQSNCVPMTTKYVPVCSMWRNRIFFDCSGINKSGPGWYRTKVDNLDKQVCYFNEARNDQVYMFL